MNPTNNKSQVVAPADRVALALETPQTARHADPSDRIFQVSVIGPILRTAHDVCRVIQPDDADSTGTRMTKQFAQYSLMAAGAGVGASVAWKVAF